MRIFIPAFCVLLLGCCFARTQATAPTKWDNVERARTILKDGLDSSDYSIRIEAITATSMIGHNEVLLSRLEQFLHDKNIDVRLATVNTLGDLHTERREQILRTVVADERTPEVSFAAAKILAASDDPTGIQALMAAYDGSRKTRSNALKKRERSFFEKFHSAPSAVLFIVGEGIGSVPVPGAGEGFTAISQLLKDPGLSDRASVVLILARKRGPESLGLLRNALQDKDWSVRAAAAQMIAHTARLDLHDALPSLFDDKNQKVRFRAAGAYLHLLLVERKAEKKKE